MAKRTAGKVYLVGAGPGDPELLTLRAHRLLREARLVLHDDLVPAEIVALANPQAEVVNVGKRCGAKRITQAEINQRMISAARAGSDVVRLKSGDPAIFGRLGEELDALQAADVDFEIVPGITAGIAAAASLGMSLTDRRTASRLLIASVHHADGKAANGKTTDVAPREKPDWSGLVREDTTLILYMPGHGLAGLRDELLEAGLASDTPAIIVSRATTHRQQHRHTRLGEIDRLPEMAAPSVLLIGRALARTGARSSTPGVTALVERAELLLSQR
jgi:uroporphyrin-III C-methyltransferase